MLDRITSAGTAAQKSSKCTWLAGRPLLLAILLLCAVFSVSAQTKNYKDKEICTDSTQYKGKKNHGKFHCTGSIVVREYSNGKKDTIMWMPAMQTFMGDEYQKYKQLSERGKYIVDSLKEDGIPMFQDNYLTYEPIYMKPGKETYKSWKIIGTDISIYYYSIWNNSKANGFELIKEVAVK